MRHVPGRIDVDQHSDAGNKQQPDGGQRIEQESGIGVEWGRSSVVREVGQMAGVGAQPGVENFFVRLAGLVGGIATVLPNRSDTP